MAEGDSFFQIVAAVFAVGLAIRYFLTYKEEKIYDQVEKKPRIIVSGNKVSSAEDCIDQLDGYHQASSSQNTDKQALCASFKELNHTSERTIASENSSRTRPGLNSLSRTKTMNEAYWKDSSISLKNKVLERRRTVSEGHCSNDCQPNEDSLHPPEVIRTNSSPPRVEHKERSLEECKAILKQSVCQSCLVIHYFPSFTYVIG